MALKRQNGHLERFFLAFLLSTCVQVFFHISAYGDCEGLPLYEDFICRALKTAEFRPNCRTLENDVKAHRACLAFSNLALYGDCRFSKTVKNPISALICEKTRQGLDNSPCNMTRDELKKLELPAHFDSEKVASFDSFCGFGRYLKRNHPLFLQKYQAAHFNEDFSKVVDRLISLEGPLALYSGVAKWKGKIIKLGSAVAQVLIQKYGVGFFTQPLTYVDWAVYIKEWVSLLEDEKIRKRLTISSLKEDRSFYYENQVEGGFFSSSIKLPSPIEVHPNGDIIIHLNVLRIYSNTIKIPPLGKGVDKSVILSFNYDTGQVLASAVVGNPYSVKKDPIENLSDKGLVGKELVRFEEEDMKKAIAYEANLQASLNRNEGLVELLSFSVPKTKDRFLDQEILLLMNQKYYPYDLITFHWWYNNSIESIEGLTRDEVIVEIAISLLKGLVKIHKQGTYHGDIKPDNILVNFDERGYPKGALGDFGASIRWKSPPPLSKMRNFGSPYYFAPEMVDEIFNQSLSDKNYTKRDLWALGLSLYAFYEPHKARPDLTPDEWTLFKSVYKDRNLIFDPDRVRITKQYYELANRIDPQSEKNPVLKAIAQLLMVDPDRRPDTEQALQLFLDVKKQLESIPNPHFFYRISENLE